MSKRLLSFLALALLCFSFLSVTIQAPAHAETQCYYPGTTGFSKPRNDYEAGQCNPATNGKIFAGKCNICRGNAGTMDGDWRCHNSCKSGYTWVKSNPLLKAVGYEGGCCAQ